MPESGLPGNIQAAIGRGKGRVEAQAPAPFWGCNTELTCSPCMTCMSHAPILYLEIFSSGMHLNLYNHFDHTPKAARVNNLV